MTLSNPEERLDSKIAEKVKRTEEEIWPLEPCIISSERTVNIDRQKEVVVKLIEEKVDVSGKLKNVIEENLQFDYFITEGAVIILH